MKKLLCIGLVVLLLVACHRTAPQTPSNKVDDADTVALSMVELNQRLAAEADEEVRRYVQASGLNFAQEAIGSWTLLTERTTNSRVTKHQSVLVHQQVFTLDSVMLEDAVETIEAGKKQTIDAVDLVVLQMNRGEKATLICPWYSAFGQIGTSTVPPYTNVRIELDIN